MKTPVQILDLSSSYIRPSDATGTLLALLSTDVRAQTFNVTVAKTVTLPTTGVAIGDAWIIENVGTAAVSLQSSNGSALATVQGTRCVARALVSTPTTTAHWAISNPGEQLFVYTAGSSTFTGTFAAQSLLVPVGTWALYGHHNTASPGGGTDTVMLSQIEISSLNASFQDNESFAICTFQGVANAGMRTGTWPLEVTLTSATTIYLNVYYVRILGTVPTSVITAQRTLRAVRQN